MKKKVSALAVLVLIAFGQGSSFAMEPGTAPVLSSVTDEFLFVGDAVWQNFASESEGVGAGSLIRGTQDNLETFDV